MMRIILALIVGMFIGAELEEAWEAKCREVEEAKAWEDALQYQAQEWVERAAGGGR